MPQKTKKDGAWKAHDSSSKLRYPQTSLSHPQITLGMLQVRGFHIGRENRTPPLAGASKQDLSTKPSLSTTQERRGQPIARRDGINRCGWAA
jgi:hypothetical protein